MGRVVEQTKLKSWNLARPPHASILLIVSTDDGLYLSISLSLPLCLVADPKQCQMPLGLSYYTL